MTALKEAGVEAAAAVIRNKCADFAWMSDAYWTDVARLALEAAAVADADRIEQLERQLAGVEAERDANGLEAHQMRGERDAARNDAGKWLRLHDEQEARAEAAERQLAYPQGMQFSRRADQLPNYENAIAVRRSLQSEGGKP